MKKKIAILGSTGSIGTQALEVIDKIPDEFDVVALSAGNNIDLISSQIEKYTPKVVSVKTEKDAIILQRKYKNTEFVYGENGLLTIADMAEINIILVAVSGKIGLKPTIRAIKNKKGPLGSFFVFICNKM